VSEIEWGVAYRLRRHSVTGRPGPEGVHPLEDRAAAETELAAFTAEAENFEVFLKWRTAAVEAGPWQDAPQADDEIPEGYIFVFGLGSQLARRYVALKGSAEETRSVICQIFGGYWSRQLSAADGAATVRRRGWRRLVLGIPSEEGFNPVPETTDPGS
jgi:hypothetical protein